MLGIVIGATGAALVYETQIDAFLNPGRYAVSGDEVALPVSAYFKRAGDVLGPEVRLLVVRLPHAAGMPVVVFGRARGKGAGLIRVHLDPSTGRVLGTAAPGGFTETMRLIHERLALRGPRGRELVGVVGIAILISSLTGLYLWWPRRGTFRSTLGFRHALSVTRNLHYLFGLYGFAVLAMLSFTGIFLSYPDAMRRAVGYIMPLSPAARNVTANTEERGERISVDEAVTIAGEVYPGARVTGVVLPGPRPAYSIRLNDPRHSAIQPGVNALLLIDQSSGAVLGRVDASTRRSGDDFLSLQRKLHAGHNLGVIGRAVIALVGFLPALFVVTGTIMWLRRRRRRRTRRRVVDGIEAAERV
jgi:uncharacterized iron-regulated membrane protein